MAKSKVPRTIQQRFNKFAKDNPKVYELFRQYAKQVRAAGHSRYSSDAILHRIRWHMTVETKSAEPFKLNDHFSSRYARRLIADDPSFADFFETRVLRRV